MNILSTTLTFCIFVSAINSAAGEDKFDSLKVRMKETECSNFQFTSIIESEVFLTVDSIDGSAWIAKDGRYAVKIGGDHYLFDGDYLHSYSSDNEQVVIETIDSGTTTGNEVLFIVRLDELYVSSTQIPNREYILRKKPDQHGNSPDSLRLFLSDISGDLTRISYFDENEDRHLILIEKMELKDECLPSLFEADWPPGTDIVKLN